MAGAVAAVVAGVAVGERQVAEAAVEAAAEAEAATTAAAVPAMRTAESAPRGCIHFAPAGQCATCKLVGYRPMPLARTCATGRDTTWVLSDGGEVRFARWGAEWAATRARAEEAGRQAVRELMEQERRAQQKREQQRQEQQRERQRREQQHRERERLRHDRQMEMTSTLEAREEIWAAARAVRDMDVARAPSKEAARAVAHLADALKADGVAIDGVWWGDGTARGGRATHTQTGLMCRRRAGCHAA